MASGWGAADRGGHWLKLSHLTHALVMLATLSMVLIATCQSAVGRSILVSSIGPGPDVVTSNQRVETFDNLQSVSCASSAQCMSVGWYRKGSKSLTLTEMWNGTAWSVLPSPNPTSSSVLDAVSCVSASFCMSVGSDRDGRSDETLAEKWDGYTWSVVRSASPSSEQNDLTDITCSSATYCMAVGYLEDVSTVDGTIAATLDPMFEMWNGVNWSLLTPAEPSTVGILTSLSCPSASQCVAVGSLEASSGAQGALTEAWNGTKWSVVPGPNPAGQSAQLLGVFCMSPSQCLSVGTDVNPASQLGAPLSETWNGSVWSVVPVHSPVSTFVGLEFLGGAYCPTTSRCLSVGAYTDRLGNDRTLVNQWNGKKWSFVTSPNPTLYSELESISCSADMHCMAVGSTATPGAQYTLAERWNGTSWSIAPTPSE
jgi:hypothetical protein